MLTQNVVCGWSALIACCNAVCILEIAHYHMLFCHLKAKYLGSYWMQPPIMWLRSKMLPRIHFTFSPDMNDSVYDTITICGILHFHIQNSNWNWKGKIQPNPRSNKSLSCKVFSKRYFIRLSFKSLKGFVTKEYTNSTLFSFYRVSVFFFFRNSREIHFTATTTKK